MVVLSGWQLPCHLQLISYLLPVPDTQICSVKIHSYTTGPFSIACQAEFILFQIIFVPDMSQMPQQSEYTCHLFSYFPAVAPFQAAIHIQGGAPSW